MVILQWLVDLTARRPKNFGQFKRLVNENGCNKVIGTLKKKAKGKPGGLQTVYFWGEFRGTGSKDLRDILYQEEYGSVELIGSATGAEVEAYQIALFTLHQRLKSLYPVKLEIRSFAGKVDIHGLERDAQRHGWDPLF